MDMNLDLPSSFICRSFSRSPLLRTYDVVFLLLLSPILSSSLSMLFSLLTLRLMQFRGVVVQGPNVSSGGNNENDGDSQWVAKNTPRRLGLFAKLMGRCQIKALVGAQQQQKQRSSHHSVAKSPFAFATFSH